MRERIKQLRNRTERFVNPSFRKSESKDVKEKPQVLPPNESIAQAKIESDEFNRSLRHTNNRQRGR